jgi:hypothetical protein
MPPRFCFPVLLCFAAFNPKDGGQRSHRETVSNPAPSKEQETNTVNLTGQKKKEGRKERTETNQRRFSNRGSRWISKRLLPLWIVLLERIAGGGGVKDRATGGKPPRRSLVVCSEVYTVCCRLFPWSPPKWMSVDHPKSRVLFLYVLTPATTHTQKKRMDPEQNTPGRATQRRNNPARAPRLKTGGSRLTRYTAASPRCPAPGPPKSWRRQRCTK